MGYKLLTGLGQKVSTHSRLKAAGDGFNPYNTKKRVSTHSRLKAAGGRHTSNGIRTFGFNTQPPKGGWNYLPITRKIFKVSTHSRLKAAGAFSIARLNSCSVSTHSRLKAAGLFYIA